METNLVLLLMVLIGVAGSKGLFMVFMGRSDDNERPLTKAMKKDE